jgi:adenine-specific DNA-methyltransferase
MLWYNIELVGEHMFIMYDDKKTSEEILRKSKLLGSIELDKNKSYLIKGDNFDILSKINNGLNEKVDLIYIDPPFSTDNIFTITKDRSSTISRAKDGYIAYGDDMGVEEYIEFIRERLIIMRELLSDEGSIYLHIDSKIGHYIRMIMDEIFGVENFKNDIARIKCNPKNFKRKAYGNEKDMILFYAKNSKKNIFNNIKIPLNESDKERLFCKVDKRGERYTTVPCHAPGETQKGVTGGKWKGMLPPEGRHWRTDPKKLDELDEMGLIEWSKTGNPRIIKYAYEHKGKKMQDIWEYKDPQYPIYPTEKNMEMAEMIIKQSSKESSTVMDCFAGSGTTLHAAAKLNRRWIGIDQSQVAIDIVRKRLKEYEYEYAEFTGDKVSLEENDVPLQLKLL